MTQVITQRELRNNSGQILRDVIAGDTYIIASGKVPVAELRPLEPKKKTVRREEFAAYAATAPQIDAARFRADIDEYLDSELA